MRELLRTLWKSIESGRPVTYCRLVETRGSTPQKAGAGMLVYADGSQTCTLGGGCVEAEVKRRALARLADGQAEIATFDLDSDYGWDDGLICGGRMKVFIQPISCEMEITKQQELRRYFSDLNQRVAAGSGITEAIAFDSPASDSNTAAAAEPALPIPSLYLLDSQGNVAATLHAAEGMTAHPRIFRQLRSLADRPRAYAGQGIAYLPLLSRCRLLIVGAGHVGKAVADWAAELDFDVWIVDDREPLVSRERFPGAERRIAGDIDTVLPSLDITPDTYCLIVTRGHNHDEEALYHLAERGARYVGLIGSRRKIKLIFDDLREKGVSAEALQKVYAPLGIDIGSQTVPEIAISICAELVAHRNRGLVPGRPAAIGVQ